MLFALSRPVADMIKAIPVSIIDTIIVDNDMDIPYFENVPYIGLFSK
jgi:hypothetical protein